LGRGTLPTSALLYRWRQLDKVGGIASNLLLGGLAQQSFDQAQRGARL
jgi:hypothetical protein